MSVLRLVVVTLTGGSDLKTTDHFGDWRQFAFAGFVATSDLCLEECIHARTLVCCTHAYWLMREWVSNTEMKSFKRILRFSLVGYWFWGTLPVLPNLLLITRVPWTVTTLTDTILVNFIVYLTKIDQVHATYLVSKTNNRCSIQKSVLGSKSNLQGE